MPSATFRHSATTPCTLEEVWEQLQSVESWANIGPVEKVWDPVHDDAALRSYRWSTTVGSTEYDGSAVVTESRRPDRMKLDLDASEVVGSLLAEISTNGDGTAQIAVTLEVASRGMLSTLFFPVISEAVGRGLPQQVEAFAASFACE